MNSPVEDWRRRVDSADVVLVAAPEYAGGVTWQGAYVVAELGITAPRTKSDDEGRFTDVPTVTSILSLTELLLDAAAMPATVLVDVAGRVVGSLGIDTAHLTPAL